jgi:hypothetical protein
VPHKTYCVASISLVKAINQKEYNYIIKHLNKLFLTAYINACFLNNKRDTIVVYIDNNYIKYIRSKTLKALLK